MLSIAIGGCSKGRKNTLVVDIGVDSIIARNRQDLDMPVDGGKDWGKPCSLLQIT